MCRRLLFATMANFYMGQSNKDHQIDNDSNGFQQQLTALQLAALSSMFSICTHIHMHTYVDSQQVFLSKDLLKWRKREFRSSVRMYVCMHTASGSLRTYKYIQLSERVYSKSATPINIHKMIDGNYYIVEVKQKCKC